MNAAAPPPVLGCMLCLLSALLIGLGCSPSNTNVQVAGKLSPNDLTVIKETVDNQLLTRWGSTDARPIKAIEVTTNNSYRHDLLALSHFESHAKTNASAASRLSEIRERIRSRPASESTNRAVNVWYADKNARWGEAGYVVEQKGSNKWEVVSELFR